MKVHVLPLWMIWHLDISFAEQSFKATLGSTSSLVTRPTQEPDAIQPVPNTDQNR